MKALRIAVAIVCLAAGLASPAGAQTLTNTTTSSSCPICDCNDKVALCRINCQGSGDSIAVQQCNIKCTQSYSLCVDQAYRTIRAQQQLKQQQQQSTTTAGATAVGTSTTGGTTSTVSSTGVTATGS